MKKNILRIAVQKSGRLADATLSFLKRSGFELEMTDRSLVAKCRNFPFEILFLRTRDIPEVVCDNVADIGICGQDTIREQNFCNLQEVERLGFGRCQLAIAAPKKINLFGKKIATSYPKLLGEFLRKKKIKAEVIPFSGSVEIAPTLGIADAVCDLVSTGSTLRMNGLVELDRIFASEAVLIARKDFLQGSSELLENFLMRIRSTLQAKKSKYIVMNAPKSALARIQKFVPGIKSPTISPLADPNFVSVASVVDEDVFWETIEKLRAAGASGILVLPIEKMIL